MKALDILESLQLAIFDANIKNTSIKFSNTYIENIQEAIEELESLEQQNTALQARIEELEEPKKCGDCAHIIICQWSRGADDEKCGKFEPIEEVEQ